MGTTRFVVVSLNIGTCSVFQQPLDLSMITSQLRTYVAISVFCVLKASSLDTFTAAVYEHAVILPNATLTAVPRQEALALMNRNLDLLEGAIISAAKQVPPLKCASFYVGKE